MMRRTGRSRELIAYKTENEGTPKNRANITDHGYNRISVPLEVLALGLGLGCRHI